MVWDYHVYQEPNQNTPGVKKVVAENLKKAILKKMRNQNEWPRPVAVDGIKIFDNFFITGCFGWDFIFLILPLLVFLLLCNSVIWCAS